MKALEQFSLQGKVALVTGAASGLGRTIAIGLAEAGADIAILDLNNGSDTRSQILQLNRKCHNFIYDLRNLDTQKATKITEDIISNFGRLDILVNNAGMIRRSPSELVSERDWKEIISLNLDAVFYLAQAVVKHYLKAKTSGKIINLASMLSFQGGYQVASYAATKSAVAGLTRALANEWASHGINVNAVAPGYFKTEVTRDIYTDPDRNQRILERIPAGRWGQNSDLKGAIVYLASDAARYVHGAILAVDGGWLGR